MRESKRGRDVRVIFIELSIELNTQHRRRV